MSTMAAMDPQDLERQLEATRRILRMISTRPSEVMPVFESIGKAAIELCEASSANVFTFDGRLLHVAALEIKDPLQRAAVARLFPQPPGRHLAACRAVLEKRIVEIPDVLLDADYAVAKDFANFRSIVAVPLMREGEPLGAFAVGRPTPGPFPRNLIPLLQAFADQAVIAIENSRLIARLEAEIEAHRRAKSTIRQLVDDESAASGTMIGAAPAWLAVRRRIAQVAATDAAVLVTGASGTGKEAVARAIHAQGKRADKPMVRLNCAAIPRELVDSELFGHEKGAFTGAVQSRRGRFELADGGTLFLDEVGELPPEVQPRLLRVLQEGEYERVGGEKTLRCDVRVIAATNRDLEAAIRDGRFREDLYYRLNVFPIALPALRERREDIAALVSHFVERTARRLGLPLPPIDAAFLAHAQAQAWPGNVRELEHWIERVMITSDPGRLELPDAAPAVERAPATVAPSRMGDATTLEAVERAHIEQALLRTHGRIEGKDGAAAQLGMNASTLRNRMRKLGIRKPA